MWRRLIAGVLAFGLAVTALASVTVNINGTNYTIPEVGERGWGSNVTSWIQAASSGLLQKSGGTFSLTADTDFGSSFGLKSTYYKSRNATPATTGQFRLGNTEGLYWRNAANSANLGLSVNASDILTYNGNPIVGTSALGASSVVLTDSGGALTTTTTLARNKVASGTASHVLVNDGSGNLSSEAQLAITRGGTGQATAAAGFDALAPTTTNGDMILRAAGTNARLPVGASGQVLKVVGSAPTWSSFSGGVNYVSANPDAEGGTTGWATYADAAGSVPVDGTGGSPNELFTQSSSSPLRGTYSFQLAKDAANRQGQGVSYDFTVDRADLAKPLMISFDYEASGVFTGGDSSDIRVFIYDVTNASLITPAPYTLQCAVNVQCRFLSYFQTASNSSSYRLILHTATTNASVWALKLDNVYVGPDQQSYGSPVSDWVAFSPNMGATNTTYTGYWRRVGDSMEVQVGFTFSGAPSAFGSVNLPTGFTIDTAKLANATAYQSNFGEGMVYISGSAQPLHLTYSATTGLAMVYEASTSNQITPTSPTAPYTLDATSRASVWFRVPIAGWSSTVLMSNDTDTRVCAARYRMESSMTASTTNPVNFDTKIVDTHNAVTTSATAWKFTAPLAGIYRISASMYSSATSANVNLFKNGSIYATLGAYTTAFYGAPGSVLVSMNPGDYIDVRPSTSAVLSVDAASGYPNAINIERLTGPSAIAASESINARYTSIATTSFGAGTTTNFVCASKDYDSHGSFDGTTFTATSSGKYSVKASFFANASTNTVGEYSNIFLYKNGSYHQLMGGVVYQTTSSITTRILGAATVSLNAGDTIKTMIDNGSSSAKVQNGSATENWISVERIGN